MAQPAWQRFVTIEKGDHGIFKQQGDFIHSTFAELESRWRTEQQNCAWKLAPLQ
ncbi:MAG: hypothetical protein KDD40_07595 [Bdellovibrionales bacterium]|nr:hypothetical protein [Bdellovibrionales bacterium]